MILKGITPRKYQEDIFNTCKYHNTMVVLPTGLGKTLIAVMLAVERLEKFGGKVIMLAPTKPLVEQHIKSFEDKIDGYKMSLFTGSIKAEKRAKLFEESDIIFSTPQCIANDINKELYDLKEVTLLIEDEVHRCVKNYDYTSVVKKYKEDSKNQRIIGLTASPGSTVKQIKEIAYNLDIEEIEIRTRESDDVKGYLQDLEYEQVKVYNNKYIKGISSDIDILFNEYMERISSRRVLKSYNKVTLIHLQGSVMSKPQKDSDDWIISNACTQGIRLLHSKELIETQTIYGFNLFLKGLIENKSRGSQELINKQLFKKIYTLSKKIELFMEHPKISALNNLIKSKTSERIIIFANFRDTGKIIVDNINNIEGINAELFVGQAKKNGIGMTQKEQKAMIEKFREGEINVLVATSIAEEGLDIPEVNAVVFYEPVSSAIRSIQRRGRTARLSKGKLIMLMTKNTKDEYSFFTSIRREKQMAEDLEKVRKELENGKIVLETQTEL